MQNFDPLSKQTAAKMCLSKKLKLNQRDLHVNLLFWHILSLQTKIKIWTFLHCISNFPFKFFVMVHYIAGFFMAQALNCYNSADVTSVLFFVLN